MSSSSNSSVTVKAVYLIGDHHQKQVFTTDRNRLLSKKQIIRELRSKHTDRQIVQLLDSSPLEGIQLTRKSKRSSSYVPLVSAEDFANLKRSLTVKNNLKLHVTFVPVQQDTQITDYTKEVQKFLKRIEDLFSSNENVNLKSLSSSISDNLTNSDFIKAFSNLIDVNLSKIVVKMEGTSETAPEPEMVVHKNVHCDGCNKQIEGVRYKCLECHDFDFCSQCEENNAEAVSNHLPDHQMLKIKKAERPKLGARNIVVGYVTPSSDEFEPSVPEVTVESAQVYDKDVSDRLLELGANNGEKLNAFSKQCAQAEFLLKLFEQPQKNFSTFTRKLADVYNGQLEEGSVHASCFILDSRVLFLGVTNRLHRDLSKPVVKLSIDGITNDLDLPELMEQNRTVWVFAHLDDWKLDTISAESVLKGEHVINTELREDATEVSNGVFEFVDGIGSCVLQIPDSGAESQMEVDQPEKDQEQDSEFVVVGEEEYDLTGSDGERSLFDDYDILSPAECED
ncbi:hypothetical protein OGAPHI_005217 [Ogataea philodendri]|uniref:ZZ-type domain-containing protein n=1 Tax=Ogataea philodendri TaxID=1378263 RepID=A0A9P8T346_9ASCO|nr:uncharacterized protein OGAPHI_005217 [Ogataea philodendri]KAH3663814.1 hypothetical protein OGAPHI_005217 [Ogataea philodendri]